WTSLFNINHRHRRCEWGICIGPATRWGKGYGTEACRLAVSFAFKELGLGKVYLDVYESNERARRAYEKAGFEVEGKQLRHAWLHGRFETNYIMAAYPDHPIYSEGDDHLARAYPP